MKTYAFGSNYNALKKEREEHLTEVYIMAETEEEAYQKLIALVGKNSKTFWYNGTYH